jgi:SagB-type dehydrogenase family enzyme
VVEFAAGAADGAARAYHDATKHSWQSTHASPHFLDWEIKPFPFKVYPDAPTVALPRDLTPPGLPALEALAGVTAGPGRGLVDLAALATLLFFSAGLTKKKAYPGGGATHFRAAASTGALYEVEVYVVAGAVGGLDPGVYHFSPGDFVLRQLRGGDYRDALAEAAGDPARVPAAPATLVLSAIYWRNTWKYQARAFRHFFWDAGTLAANLLATSAALDVPAPMLLGFADRAVNGLLGLDPSREGALALVPLGAGAHPPDPALPVEPLAARTVPLSSREVDYPLVRAAYAASSLPDGAAARAWVRAATPAAGGFPDRPVPPSPALGEVILRRGSTRQFGREAITEADLAVILDTAVRDLPLDTQPAPLVDVYVLVHAVSGLASGAYVYDSTPRALRLLRAGEFRQEGGYLCLGQSLGADASAVVFFLSDLGAVLRRFGDRGYRAVNLVAGLLGGRMYLAAYALGLGASGLTFYDDDVVGFFLPDAAGKDAIFATALGRAGRPGQPGGLPQIAGELSRLRPGESG